MTILGKCPTCGKSYIFDGGCWECYKKGLPCK